jgi:hypothetical protein
MTDDIVAEEMVRRIQCIKSKDEKRLRERDCAQKGEPCKET